MEVRGDQKTVCSDPGGGVGKAGCAESQQVYKNKSYDRTCRHFKDTGQNSDLTVPHALNAEAQHIDTRQRDEEKAVAAGFRPCAVCMQKKYIEWKNDNMEV